LNKVDKKAEEFKRRKKHNRTVSKDAGVRSWEAKKVRAFVNCYDCGKRRLVCVRNKKCRLAQKVL
jgi:hypothetical protein